ncbi:MAG: zinc metalloprotease HtpX [Thiovulaceae bacterium]|nr:zinc metalloprotease HtpX [Sulfurimonadaceae bacterium]
MMTRHKIFNIIQTVVIVTMMTGFMVLLGVFVGGLSGLLITFLVMFSLIFFYPSIKPELIAKFYRAQELRLEQAPILYAYVDQLAKRAKTSHIPKLFIISSPLSLAFTVGKHRNSIIMLSSALIQRLELPEVVGVLAHEMAHIANKDLWLMSVTDIISRMTAIFSIIGQMMIIIYLPAFFMADVNVPWLIILILVLAPFINIVLSLTLSKVREYEADATAAYLLGDPTYLAQALGKIEFEEQYFLARLIAPIKRRNLPSLFRTHPLTDVRIKKLMEIKIPSSIKPIIFHERPSFESYDLEDKEIHRLLRYLLGN